MARDIVDSFREGNYLSSDDGVKTSDTDNRLKVADASGHVGPALLKDQISREKITRFDHERIPERVVHARGIGAIGHFNVYDDRAKKCTSAGVLSDPTRITPVFFRFSTRIERYQTGHDPRRAGLRYQVLNEEGNWDLVGNNIPIFFIQDAVKLPDIIHAVKPEPHNEVPQGQSAHNNFWDFVGLQPESAHMVMWVMYDRGIPCSYRMMQGFDVSSSGETLVASRMSKSKSCSSDAEIVWMQNFHYGNAQYSLASYRSLRWKSASHVNIKLDRFPQKVEDIKARICGAKIQEHFNQVQLFVNSLNPNEKQHLIDGASFELNHCDDPVVYEQYTRVLNNIDLELAKAIAINVGGIVSEVPDHANQGKVSKALSQTYYAPKTPLIKIRRIAILVGDRFDLAEVEAVRAALVNGLAMVFLIGPRRGEVFPAAVPFLRDAVHLPGIEFQNDLGSDVVKESYGVVTSGMYGIKAALEDVLEIGPGEKGNAANFAYAVNKHRCYEREVDGLTALVAF
ncbi:hypothetical protein EWM64_g686 [Hericium alpestre]|uniref:catalase n=1 Tax=Hericium alpestre TaxID=135208 RepID=A0A4Z0A8B5_9AGAM|nr:hypothetical protein EWM64_g686 [Hericium alpestre]